MAAGLAILAAAQPAQQKMGASSTLVYGAVSDGKQGANLVSRAAGFFIDSRHVVSNVLDCCGKSDKGEQVVPIVSAGKDDAAPAKVIWSNQDYEIAILELAQPLNHPGVTIAPGKLQQQGAPVYSMQYPKPGENGPGQLVEGKLTGTGSKGDSKIAMFTSSVQMNSNNAGGALFDACGNAIGINLLMKDGEQYAFAIDPLIDALKAAGVQATVTDQPCGSGPNTSSGSSAPPPRSEGKEETKQGKQAPAPQSSWRLPQGNEWIPVAIVLGLIVLAIRPARRKMARAAPAPVPQAEPYAAPGAYPGVAPPPMPPPGYAAAGPSYVASAPPVQALKPVLRGIVGEYTGSSFPLETGASTLGRDPQAANLVFGGEAWSVSKRHCSVRWDAGRGVFLLEDHGSTNGTFLASGERLPPNQPRELRAGDRFSLGDLRNQFEVAME